jgi:integrase/recombinase XerD
LPVFLEEFRIEEGGMASRVWNVRVAGPLEPYRVGFERALADVGYTPLSAANQMGVMRHLSLWLEERDRAASELVPVVVVEYLAQRRAEGYTCWLSVRGLTPLLTYLRGLGVAPVPVAPAPTGLLEELVERYRCHLVTERGLVATTVRYYLADARVFLAGWVDASSSRLGQMDAAQVTTFVVGQCACRSVGSAKILVTVMRSVLRFLLLDGSLQVDLSGAVPAVAGWRGSHLPKGITPADAGALLASCDRRQYAPGRPRADRAAGERPQLDTPPAASRRDRAVLLLSMRLGLRAVEVARLQLDDLDWRRGEVVIRGKGRRDERLPLPTDVGEAIVAYLRHDRPSVAGRSLFTTVRVPYSPMTATAVKRVAVTAAGRAGLTQVSAHRLRHTAATDMIGAQASLAEVGQVLRHRSASTTAIYAKVDRGRLRELAMAWPEVAR